MRRTAQHLTTPDEGTPRAMRKLAAVLSGTTLILATGVLLGAPTASAAQGGDITLDPTTGSTGDVFATATAPACEAAYNQSFNYRISVPGTDPSANLQVIQNDGGYDAGPIVIAANRSLNATALGVANGGVIPDGTYAITIQCFAETGEPQPTYYGTTITVTGATWEAEGDDPPPPPADTAEEKIQVTVPEAPPVPEALTITVDPADDTVVMSEAVLDGDRLRSEGELRPVTVTDTRVANPGWTVSGQVSDFVSATDTFDGKYLGWAPKVISQDAGMTVVPGPVVPPGFDSGNGLKDPSTLAEAAAGAGFGTAVLGADLDLELPTTTPAGEYEAILTLTAI